MKWTAFGLASVALIATLFLSVSCDRAGQVSQPAPPSYDANTAAGADNNGQGEGAGAALALPAEMDMLEVTRMFNRGQTAASQPTGFATGAVRRSGATATATPTDYGWRLQLPSGSPVATPAVAAGLVYLTGGYHSNDMFCFNAATGAQQWAVTLSDNGPSMPVVSDSTVIVNTESCTIFALDAQTGSKKWAWYLGDPQLSAPAIGGGLVITSYPTGSSGGTSHGVVALDLTSGQMKWRTLVDGDVISSPVVHGQQVLASTFSGMLYRLDLETGSPISASSNRASSAPSVVGDDVYFARRSDPGAGGPYQKAIGAWLKNQDSLHELSEDRQAPYLDPRVQDRSKLAGSSRLLDVAVGFGDGTPIAVSVSRAKEHLGHATVAALQAFQSSRPLVVGDRLFSSMGDRLVCFDRTTGDALWEKVFEGDLAREGGSLVTAPAYAGRSLIVGTVDGRVLRLGPATGDVQGSWRIGAPIRQQPAIDAGNIFVPTANGQLHCIQTGDPQLTGWSGWGGNPQRTSAVAR